MTIENKLIKVKDTKAIGRAIIFTCLFPLIFIFISINLDLSYLLTALISLTLFGAVFILLVRYLNSNENVYAIIADTNSISIKNTRTVSWSDIDKIETFSQKPIGHRISKKYLKLILKNGEQVVLDASNYDIWYEDLKNELILLKNKNNRA